jgi:signal transduction histidine kinase
VVLAVSVVLIRALKEEEQSLIRHLTAGVASAVRGDIEGDLDLKVLAPLRHAELWDPGTAATAARWRERARAFRRAHPLFRAVGWAASGGTRHVLPADATLLADVPLDQLLRPDARPSSRELHGLLEPVFLSAQQRPDGTWLRRVAVPVFRDENLLGVGLAEFSEQEAFDDVLRDLRGRGYAIAIADEGGLTHVEPGTAPAGPAAWTQVVTVGLAGHEWHVRVWPTASVLEELQSRLPETVLVLGLALAVFVWLTLHFHVRLHQRAAEAATANALLRDLNARLFQLQDDERRRLARALHGGTAQTLAALGMHLGLAKRVAASDERRVRTALDDGLQMVRESTSDVQALAYRLHPLLLEDLGLAAALSAYAEQLARQTGLQIAVHISSGIERLDRTLELGLFRVVEEALTNVVRHSGSKTAQLTLQESGAEIRAAVADQGRGIPGTLLARITAGEPVPGVGVAGMRERVRQLGGALVIESSAQGTRVEARLPLHQARQAVAY